MSEQLKAAAERLIETVERNLPRWRSWFPNEQAEVDVPRADLLALMHFAKIGLQEHLADAAIKHMESEAGE